MISGESYGRSPRVTLPEATPAYSNGMTVSPSNATSQRSGRENATPLSFPARGRWQPFHRLLKFDARHKTGQGLSQHLRRGAALLPDDGEDIFAAILFADFQVLGSPRRSFWQNPSPAGVAMPAASKARSAGGPLTRSSRSGWRGESDST